MYVRCSHYFVHPCIYIWNIRRDSLGDIIDYLNGSERDRKRERKRVRESKKKKKHKYSSSSSSITRVAAAPREMANAPREFSVKRALGEVEGSEGRTADLVTSRPSPSRGGNLASSSPPMAVQPIPTRYTRLFCTLYVKFIHPKARDLIYWSVVQEIRLYKSHDIIIGRKVCFIS